MSDVLREGEVVARNVTIATFFLAIAKLFVGIVTNSVAILADAFHSFSDLIPIFAAYLGLRIAQRPKSEEFPYGYYKAENLAALFASLFIFLLGFEILGGSVSRLLQVAEVSNDLVGIGMIILAFLVSLVLYRYQMGAAKKTGSQALMANALETRMDLLATVLVFIGFVSAMFRVPYVEGAVGMLLSLFVFYAGYESARDSVLALMDAGVSQEDLKGMRMEIESIPRIKSVKDLYARKSGPFLMVEAVVTVPPGLDVNQAHEIADEVEKRLTARGNVDHAVVHVEPEKKERLIARPVNEDRSLARVFGSAPYFEIYREENGKREFISRVRNPGYGLEKKRGVKAALFLVDKGIDSVEVVNIGKDSREILERAGVKVMVINA